MKCKVVNEFIDKETKVFNETGAVIEVSEARYKEIVKKGNYLAIVEEEKPAPKSRKKTAEK